MTHDQLAAFSAVATEGSFTAAAKKLHKSQSALSKLVSHLEREIGLVLFDRAEYRATLTHAGGLFLARVQVTLENFRELQSFGSQLAEVPEPVLRLAVDAVTPLSRVLSAIHKLEHRFPQVRVELSTEHMGGSVEALDEGRVDVAIASGGALDKFECELQPFHSVAIVAVVHREHPMAKLRGVVPPRVLRAHPQIVLSDSAQRVYSPSVNVLHAGLQWRVSELSSKREVIMAGLGWGGLPRHLIVSELRRGVLVELAVREFRSKSIDLFVVRRRAKAGVVAQTLWNTLCATPT